jgi:hypothetical protein
MLALAAFNVVFTATIVSSLATFRRNIFRRISDYFPTSYGPQDDRVNLYSALRGNIFQRCCWEDEDFELAGRGLSWPLVGRPCASQCHRAWRTRAGLVRLRRFVYCMTAVFDWLDFWGRHEDQA